MKPLPYLISCVVIAIQSHLHSAAEDPNIIVIFTDDHATQALSAYGHPIGELAPTPNIDRLADEGMRFDRCYVTNSICGPARATVLTGTHTHINGMEDNFTDFDGSQVTFPKLLQNDGYQTAMIGKWHLHSTPTGFDHWEILDDQGYYYNPDFITSSGEHQETGYVTDIITEKTLTWLEHQRDRKKPFLLMMQHKAPHREWSPAPRHLGIFDDVSFPEPDTLLDDYETRGTPARKQAMSLRSHMELGKDMKIRSQDDEHNLRRRTEYRMNKAQRQAWTEAYAARNKEYDSTKDALQGDELVRWKYQNYMRDYLACVRGVDDSVGELLDYLDETGLADNTIVVYASDQGFYLGEHGWYDKRFMYEESFRTPFLIRWPGTTAPGQVNKDLVSNLDFAQTFLDIAGVEPDERMQGRSLVPILENGSAPDDWRDAVYYRYTEFPKWHHVYPHEGVATERYKLIHFFTIDEWELYDLRDDPNELNNRINDPKMQSTITALKTRLKALKKQYYAPENA